jgi:NAD(P)-dependent dehydrogenase (short-subunit alcohol dehydrogenase family)
MKSFSLAGRTAFITGGNAGIGLSIADVYATSGARIIVNGLTDAPGVAARLTAAGCDPHIGIDADLSLASERARLIANLHRLCPVIDILVLNAAVQHRAEYAQVTKAQFDEQVAVNLSASLELISAIAPAMLERGHGRIIAIGSVQEAKPSPQMPIYAALKAAQENLIRNLALQFAERGVTCNVISPGVIETVRSRPVLANSENRAMWLARIPSRRVGQPGDCVGAALLLASDAGSYITGQTIRVDGGLSIA